jgi:acid phosphatase (class A)
MHRSISLALAVAGALALPASLAAQEAPAAKAPKQFTYLRAEDFPAVGILPAPPARGSEVEKLELAYLHSLIADASPQRLEQARWDDGHEDPAIFDQAVGTDLEKLPATWALLRAVQNDAALAATGAKAHFARMRPWGVDPTLPNCDAGKGKQPTNSYPSGHATLGYSVGLTLATLMPARAKTILDRARDYALSREICGVHFPSDTEASHVIASIAVARILQNPAAAPRLAAARAELAAFDK